MDLFEGTLLNLMCISFPLLIYIICTIYIKNLDRKMNYIILDIALYSSVYLLIKFGTNVFIYPLLLLNIPLLIAALRKRMHSVIILSILLVLYYRNATGIEILYLALEYVIYFIGYLVYCHGKDGKINALSLITAFSTIKAFMMSFKVFYFIPDSITSVYSGMLLIFLTMIFFTILAFMVAFLLEKGEEAIDLNRVVYELEKEKKLRESLFKITHEIKNPIAVCKGYLDMMDYRDIDKVERYNSIIKDEINRTLILMDDFLDYTKIKVEKEEAYFYLLIEYTCDIMKPLFNANDVSLKLDIPDDELYMELDYNRLKQVLVNLLKNSIEAKDKKKKSSYISIKAFVEGDDVNLIIKDNGVGMSQKSLDKVDEMFYTTKEKGTGLGVALSKEIIYQHDGSISYDSVKGKYTTVTIKLPIDEDVV